MLVAGGRVMIAERGRRRLHLVVHHAARGGGRMTLGALLLLFAGEVSGERRLPFALEVIVSVLLGRLLARESWR
jgi:hypothetical protein